MSVRKKSVIRLIFHTLLLSLSNEIFHTVDLKWVHEGDNINVKCLLK